MMNEDLAGWTTAELRKRLKHYRGKTKFWDDDDRKLVQAYVERFEVELTRRGAMV